jgi:membrane-bound ClpP family serine protease
LIRLSAFADEAGKSLSSQITALLRNDIRLTELRSVDKKNVSELTLPEAREIGATLTGNGIGLSALGSPMGKVEIDGKHYEAKSGGEYIDQRTEVEVVGFENSNIIVRKK